MVDLVEAATSVQRFIAATIVEPLLILFLGIFFGKLAEQAVVTLARELKRESPAVRMGARLLAWTIYLLAVGLALASLGFLRYVLYFLLGALTVVVAVSLLLSLKDFFPNAYRYHAIRQKYKQGSMIRTLFGDMTFVSVQLLDTHCKSVHGDDIYLPNRSVPLKKS